jgi:signal transduction histidine kinase
MNRGIATLAVAVALLSACASTPPALEAPRERPLEARREPPADTRTADLVSYFATVARAGPAEQKRELAQWASAYSRAPSAYLRVRLGGLHAQPAAGLRDDARALALLEPLVTANAIPAADRPIADLAALLHAQVAERQRMEKAELKKLDALREQIEAMKSIERSILQREERQRARKN